MLNVFIRIILIITFSLTISKTWAQNKYGYIILSPSTLAYGISWGYASTSKAFFTASRYCINSSDIKLTDCTTMLEFKNTCAALAIGKSGAGTSWGNNEFEVKKIALSNCNKYTTSCSIKEYVCSY